MEYLVTKQNVSIKKVINFLLALAHYLRWFWRFNDFGWRSRIGSCDMLHNPRSITIGEKVIIRKGSRLEAIGDCSKIKMKIGDGTAIQFNFHCGAADSVAIGNNVVIGGNVYITDHDHCYDDQLLPVRKNDKLVCRPVVVGDGCWLGEGSVILKGVTIGERAVIGANAVVTKDVPPYSVACGNPARIIKTFPIKQ